MTSLLYPVKKLPTTASKAPKLKWSIKKDEAEVTHSTSYRGYRAEVRNYPGTRSIAGAVLNKHDDTVYYFMYDKLKCNVKDMKQECIDWINKRKL